jgi:cytochrome b6-f complex iron-sulfur subunit
METDRRSSMGSKVTRRSLLVFGSGVVCAHALGCGGPTGSGSDVPTTLSAGSASALRAGTLQSVAGYAVAIARDSAGVYALSLVCTHQGCAMTNNASASGIVCGCHGSVFDAQGNVLRGPALQALPHFAVTADASGQLTVHTDQMVAPSTRLIA